MVHVFCVTIEARQIFRDALLVELTLSELWKLTSLWKLTRLCLQRYRNFKNSSMRKHKETWISSLALLGLRSRYFTTFTGLAKLASLVKLLARVASL